MIVRISNEGQYEISDSDIAQLNELDNAAVAACESSDEQRFRDAFVRLLEMIRQTGRPCPTTNYSARTSSCRRLTSRSRKPRRRSRATG